jgi:hypothetical protein
VETEETVLPDHDVFFKSRLVVRQQVKETLIGVPQHGLDDVIILDMIIYKGL